jgi:hypothetical protein
MFQAEEYELIWCNDLMPQEINYTFFKCKNISCWTSELCASIHIQRPVGIATSEVARKARLIGIATNEGARRARPVGIPTNEGAQKARPVGTATSEGARKATPKSNTPIRRVFKSAPTSTSVRLKESTFSIYYTARISPSRNIICKILTLTSFSKYTICRKCEPIVRSG